MTARTIVGGIFGQPTQVDIPPRSQKRIQRAIVDSEIKFSDVDRIIEFQAILSASGLNVSQVVVTTKRLDDIPVNERIIILYRDRRFWRSMVELSDGTVIEHTLSASISRIDNPVQP